MSDLGALEVALVRVGPGLTVGRVHALALLRAGLTHLACLGNFKLAAHDVLAVDKRPGGRRVSG